MINLKKISIAFVLVFSVFFLGGCQSTTKTAVVEKSGQIITKSGDEYIMKVGDDIINVTSQKVDLDTYLKKNIKVSGMFSGTTLYIDSLEEVK
ncbi:MAG: hypothetical protein WCG91_03225 [Candidatus Shapirobacteria bacterium]